MNKSQLITLAADRTGLSKKDTERVLNAVLEAVTERLSDGEKVQLSGFGTFEVQAREARVGRNPHTKQPIEIPATSVPVFKPSRALRTLIGK